MEKGLSYELDGTKQILDAIDSLNSKETIKLIKSAERKALSTNVVKPLKAALPYSADTKKGIKIVADREDKKTGLWAGVTSDSFFLRFLEGGTKVRTTEAGGNRGQITGSPKIAGIIEGSVPKVIDFFNKDFGQTMVTLMQRKLKRINK